MPVHAGTLLVDANVMLEAHRTDCWRALVSRYRIETVEECFEETQTGFQRRRPEENIDGPELRASLGAVHTVTLLQLARVDLLGGTVLDYGERALWAHLLEREDAWIVCGPDTASMKFGWKQGRRDRLTCLERLLGDIGHRPKVALRNNYGQAWHDALMHRLAMGLLG
ncbi:hypothetical protein [Antarcticirhabdus aurantiaca]|uniref:Uncharacterized protein n=1 Tax=Antarcticirhabdus aurantiaca TaxID=2606717 RepID=A0ACD4NNY7_9HYPH|nr:hypothetical protein [Antarcticirhabdus aurantiaca]WAJ28444.1 hypothetical protein OXU80_27160 [Jeongeuplla avenae]